MIFFFFFCQGPVPVCGGLRVPKPSRLTRLTHPGREQEQLKRSYEEQVAAERARLQALGAAPGTADDEGAADLPSKRTSGS